MNYEERVIADLLCGAPDGTHMEWLWQEIEDMLEGRMTRERLDAVEDMTLRDIICRVASKAAQRAGCEA